MKKLKFTGILILILSILYFGYYQLSWNEVPKSRSLEKVVGISDSTFKEQIQASSKNWERYWIA